MLYLANQRFEDKNSVPIGNVNHVNTRANGVGIMLPGNNPLYREIADMILSGNISEEKSDELMRVFEIMESNYDFIEEYVYDMRHEDTFPKTYDGQEYFLCGDSSFDFEHNRIQIGGKW